MISNLAQHTFSSEDKLFFDANILLAVFPPPSNSQGENQKKYSKLLKKVKKAAADCYIDSTIISECLNRFVRVSIAQLHPNDAGLGFKEFREQRNQEYKAIASSAEANMREILSLPNIHVIDCCMSCFDYDVMLTDFGVGHSDWNDLVIVEVCKKGCYDFVTNDGDFSDVSGLNILTYNQNLLASK